jgi:hypothetical protein
MVVLAIRAAEEFRRPAVVWLVLGATGLWTLWLSVTPGWDRRLTRWLDLGVCIGLLLISGIVMREGYTVGVHPFFATAYPVCAALTWGAARGGRACRRFALSVALRSAAPSTASPRRRNPSSRGLGNGVVCHRRRGGDGSHLSDPACALAELRRHRSRS